MKQRLDERKAALLQQAGQALGIRLGARAAPLGVAYIEQYFRRVPMEELASADPGALADIVASQLKFIRQRRPGQTLIRVFNPERRSHGWVSEHTVIEMVNDDKPFLVDSATLTLVEMGLDVQLIIHPVIRVRRSASGRLLGLADRSDASAGAESVIQIQINRQSRSELLQRIEQRLREAMADVDAAVSDWKRMIRVATETRAEMPAWAPGADPQLVRECQEFMSWLTQDQFIFLGVRDYEVAKGTNGYELRVVPGSGLGILRETAGTVQSRPLSSLAEEARKSGQEIPLIITKTNARSTVHRVGYLDYIGVLRFDRRGRTVAERRFLGLFSSSAYSHSVMQTPLLRGRARQVLESLGLHQGSHAWKTITHILETLPRDDLFQAEADELAVIAEGVLNLQERRRVRLFIRRERYGRFYSCLVYIPRERFNTENREKIQAILKRALDGRTLDYVVNVSESALARLQVIIRPYPGKEIRPDVAQLEQKIVDALRSWSDELTAILLRKHGEERGLCLAQRFCKSFPEAYKEDVSPWVAAADVEFAAAVDAGEGLRMHLYRPRRRRGGAVRLKLFRKSQPIPLSEVLPMLEHLGLRIVSERPYELHLADEQRLWIQDYDMTPAAARPFNLDAVRDLFLDAFGQALRGGIESDGFNQLVIAAEMNWRQVKVLRAYCKYLLQLGTPFSQQYMAETLARFPLIARLLIEFFEAAFDPGRDGETALRSERAARLLERTVDSLRSDAQRHDEVLGEYLEDVIRARMGSPREQQVDALRVAFRRALTTVSSLDQDRILHAFYDLIRATLRTSFFRTGPGDGTHDYISFKIDSARVADMPLPRPYREIWVYSPRFEGIHLRGGKIARGGLRWSDRREDFRTEVLGLLKAQNVKNTMIVPVGAKGGFVLKRPPAGDREALQQDGIACYRQFIHALLDLTDNLEENRVIHPERVVRRDEDDTYLVVAADKGTASFSDIANAIALERGFWLGDAFASGGSAGYDHKGMGITAKGAWESVKRHFRELGVDIQKQPFTVVGIGDMSGDVFGNGMLLSRRIRLKAAFNHQHIFLDPDPDPRAGFLERQRLFRKPRSTWDDYRRELISAGGGVFSRQDKTIALSPEVRAWLGLEEAELAPHALIRRLLTAPVDLLWNGGIGTYVKASAESNAEVGDLANNALRVNGSELRCRVAGEGGNLGFTQRGRIEYARAGGRINTDFIDNSAGVDTSDHEVNIKILLAGAIRARRLKAAERVQLLESMQGEVESLVLRSNYLQTQAISMMQTMVGPRMGAKQHFIAVLEERGVLNRTLEALPGDEELTERRKRGEGLTRPELAVLLSYAKIVVYQQLLASDLPEDPYLSRELQRYFPEPLQKRFAGLMQQHRLRREIIATQVTNSMVNRMGVSFALRMEEDTGAPPAAVAKAFTIAREIFAARDFWAAVEGLDNRVNADLQVRALLAMWNLLRQATRWILARRGHTLDVQQNVERLAPGLAALSGSLHELLSPGDAGQIEAGQQVFVEGGFPAGLARRTAMLERFLPALEVVDTAAQHRLDVTRVSQVYFGLGEVLRIKWLREQLEALPVQGQWHAQARALLRDELLSQQNRLVELVLRQSGRQRDPLGHWLVANEPLARRLKEVMDDMAGLPVMDYATVGVAIRSLGQLVEHAVNSRAG